MSGLNVIFFISLIFILGACSNKVAENNNTTEITNKKIEELKNEIINDQKSRVDNIFIGEFKSELAKNDPIIIDVRTKAELEETGIILGAKQIDYYDSDFKDKLNSLDKDKKYLIYCRSGNRSSKALSIMKDLGFTYVLELQGGMNNWIASGEKTTSYSQNMENDRMIKTITLNAKKWEFDQKIIKVQKGEKLIITVNNTDGLHGIAIPDMKLVGDTEIEVDTSKKGEFEFRCANYCGAGHQDMTGKIIIE